MVHFEVLESKLVYRDPNSQWYVSAKILLETSEIYYVLTHISNDKKHEIIMSQYAANDLKEFLRRWIYLNCLMKAARIWDPNWYCFPILLYF